MGKILVTTHSTFLPRYCLPFVHVEFYDVLCVLLLVVLCVLLLVVLCVLLLVVLRVLLLSYVCCTIYIYLYYICIAVFTLDG